MAIKRIGNININYTVPEAQTQMWNALGRDTGMEIANQDQTQDDRNFFQKRWDSIKNAFGTTGAAVASAIKDKTENDATDLMLDRHKNSLNDIYKKYGYNNSDDYYAAKDATENDVFSKYGYNSNDFWDKRAAADLAGDNDTIAKLEQERQDLISKMTPEDAERINKFDAIQNELKAQTSTNAEEATNKAKAYEDWRQNNYVSKQLAQDRGKFAGSAINTLSTATDLTGLTSGPLSNAIQGGIEGVADELEQNGLENFDWDRAKQNAAIGAASGAAVGAFNNGLSNTLAKNGGKVFAGNNALSRGINKVIDFNPTAKSTAGQFLESVGQGAVRGAASGAVGGATGAGLSAAMNGGDVLQSALQGATQGATQGAYAGGVMGGASNIISKTPGVGEAYNKINQASEDWRNSGNNFKERWENTRAQDTWGNRAINKVASGIDTLRTKQINNRAINRLASGIEAGKDGTVKFARISQAMLDDINNVRAAEGKNPMTTRQTKAVINEINNHLATHRNDFGSYEEVARAAFDVLTGDESFAAPTNRNTNSLVLNNGDRFAKSVALDEEAGIRSISPRSKNWAQKRALEREALLNSSLEGGNSPSSQQVEPESGLPISRSQTTGSIISQSEQNVNTPETQIYRTLTGETEEPFMAYGESQLGNRTRRGMLADALERFGNTLEGAQTNVTRAAAKDLGIESTGKVVENVRKKTGITNLETQANLAKELTGGENSLLDSIQRQALGVSETGEPYAVDTTPLLRDIDSIVNKHADTNIFGSQSARDKFIRNLKTDLTSYDSDVLSIANRMKATASDLRGKGVGEVPAKDKAMAKIYTEVANKLDDLSYKSIPQENVDAMFDTAISEMRSRATQAKNNGNTDISRAYTKLADNLAQEPRTIQAFRSFKKDFVDASKIANLTALAENGAAVQMGRGFGGGIKRFLGTVAQRPVNAGLAKIGGVVNNAADRIAGEAPTPTTTTPTPAVTAETTATQAYNPSTQVFNAIGRTEGLSNGEQVRTANYLTNAVQEANVANAGSLESLVAPSTGTTSVYDSVYGTPSTNATLASTGSAQTGYFQPTGDYWTDIIASAMSSAIDNNDATAFAALYGMYQDALSNLQSQTSETSGQKLTATQQRANAAMNSLDRLSQMTPDLAYNLSNIPVVGNIATFGGNDYESEAKSLAQQIGYMVSGANIKEEEAYNIGRAYVPQPWDNEQVRKNKLQRAYEIIQQYQNGYAE